MSNYNYRITENLENEVILPRRVKTLVDLYANASKNIGGDRKFSIRYELQTEDLHEKIFEDKLRLASQPGSFKILITAIYRIKHDNQEFYFYNMTRSFKNKMENPEVFSIENFGHYKKPVVSLRWNNEKGISIPEVVKYDHYFDLPWKKSEVQKLLESSMVPCENFYIGTSGIVAAEPVASPCYKINNMEDFLSGSHTDLTSMGRLGLSYPEKSLFLVEPALKQERENRKNNVGMRDKQGLYG